MDKETAIACCREQITSALLALNHPYQMVKAIFHNKDVAVINYASKGKRELSLEIRFENAMLYLLFDKGNICNGVFLFLDDPNHLSYYTQYCSILYRYNYLLKGWMHEQGIIQLHIESDKCGLVVLPTKVADR